MSRKRKLKCAHRPWPWVTGFDDFYAPKGLYRVSASDYKTCLFGRAERREHAQAINYFEKLYASLARHDAMLGLPHKGPHEIEGRNHCYIGSIDSAAMLSGVSAPHSILNRFNALHRWCRGLMAFYSATPLDKDLISDKRKLWPVIAVLGEVQSALK